MGVLNIEIRFQRTEISVKFIYYPQLLAKQVLHYLLA